MQVAGKRTSHTRGAIERGLMASLTIPQVAAALAATLVGYRALNAAGERLLDEAVLNTVLVLIVVTALTGPLLTELFVRRLPRLGEQAQES
jgi:hypothetical protein